MTPRNVAVISSDASKAFSERLLKLYGLWKTDEAIDMYILESEYNRLTVTKFLGIYPIKLISKVLSVLSLTNAVRLFFIKVLGFARDPPISDFAWFLRLFKW